MVPAFGIWVQMLHIVAIMDIIAAVLAISVVKGVVKRRIAAE